MRRYALIEHRPWLLASVLAAALYYFLRDNPIGGIQLMALKGAAVAMLAIYTWRRGAGQDGLLLTAALALAALGDVLIEIDFRLGGAAFFAAHLAAIALYLRNPRQRPAASQRAAGAALLLLTPPLCWALSGSYSAALYGLALGGMAAGAWLSRFPRYRVGIGAVLFVCSDLLLLSEAGPLDLAPLPHYLLWPLYYVGQFLIAIGVIQTLSAQRVAAAWQR